jgi:hypothetical protein
LCERDCVAVKVKGNECAHKEAVFLAGKKIEICEG